MAVISMASNRQHSASRLTLSTRTAQIRTGPRRNVTLRATPSGDAPAPTTPWTTRPARTRRTRPAMTGTHWTPCLLRHRPNTSVRRRRRHCAIPIRRPNPPTVYGHETTTPQGTAPSRPAKPSVRGLTTNATQRCHRPSALASRRPPTLPQAKHHAHCSGSRPCTGKVPWRGTRPSTHRRRPTSAGPVIGGRRPAAARRCRRAAASSIVPCRTRLP